MLATELWGGGDCNLQSITFMQEKGIYDDLGKVNYTLFHGLSLKLTKLFDRVHPCKYLIHKVKVWLKSFQNSALLSNIWKHHVFFFSLYLYNEIAANQRIVLYIFMNKITRWNYFTKLLGLYSFLFCKTVFKSVNNPK